MSDTAALCLQWVPINDLSRVCTYNNIPRISRASVDGRAATVEVSGSAGGLVTAATRRDETGRDGTRRDAARRASPGRWMTNQVTGQVASPEYYQPSGSGSCGSWARPRQSPWSRASPPPPYSLSSETTKSTGNGGPTCRLLLEGARGRSLYDTPAPWRDAGQSVTERYVPRREGVHLRRKRKGNRRRGGKPRWTEKKTRERGKALVVRARTHARTRSDTYLSLLWVYYWKNTIWNSLQDMEFLRGSERTRAKVARKSEERGPRTKHRKSYM